MPNTVSQSVSKQIFLKEIPLLLESDVEFIGIINSRGKLEDFIGKNKILNSPEKIEMFFMGLCLQNRMHQDFDVEFGSVNYIITERDYLKFIILPKSSKLILVVMKKEIDHIEFINKLMNYLNLKKEDNNPTTRRDNSY